MKIATTSIEMHCVLALSEHETRMLNHLGSFDTNAGRILAKHFGEFSEQEWNDLIRSMRTATAETMQRMVDARAVYSGRKKASLIT